MEKIAVVLVDAYRASLVVAEFDFDNNFSIVCEENENIKLGLDLNRDHFLKKPQIDDTIRVLKNYKKLCDMFEVQKTIAVCNFNSDNKPKNLYSFFDEVFSCCGFRFNLISSEDQNNAIYSSIINTYDFPKALVYGVSSESINTVLYNRRNIVNQSQLTFGPVSLIEMFSNDECKGVTLYEKIREFVRSNLSGFDGYNELEEEFSIIGSGKYYTDIAKMVRKYKKYPIEKDDDLVVTAEDLDFLEKQLLELNLDSTKKIKGIEEPRGDVFTVAVIVINILLKATGKNSLVIASRSLIHGLLIREAIPSVLEKPISDVLGFSVVSEAAHFDPGNVNHNEQVYNLSMLLFKQLRVLHKLPRGYVKVLRVASYMHDAGKRINYKNHAKLAYPVILNSNIFGITHRELILAAFVASLHEGGDIIMNEWVKYKDLLLDEDVDAVRKLGSILRLAESFDYTKSNVIVDVSCDILGDSVIMKTMTNGGDNSYEIEKANEGAKEFERFFGKKIEIL